MRFIFAITRDPLPENQGKPWLRQTGLVLFTGRVTGGKFVGVDMNLLALSAVILGCGIVAKWAISKFSLTSPENR